MRIRNNMQMPTISEEVMRAYTIYYLGKVSYLEEVLFDVAEDVCILLEFELFWAALPLVLVVDQLGEEALAAAQLSIFLDHALIVRATVNECPRNALIIFNRKKLTFTN